ncbi:biotin/lipoyl-containing protein, partial [Dermatophilus congolensis]|nr:2-oxo acid dehydrogenase subunit E2 [Dermatophilus congolensis]MBO3161585.1 2-oxo acid dehydrogenase subunit E2 [Dermatophilus congolensis]MBO3208862.1 2-oxo acid dehydrogenase subunit E2 [Dermatophilus congolensis]MBO3214625.1 2-oxo acid dehydrogenase subunit E2 [Dermatophilus congolensis]
MYQFTMPDIGEGTHETEITKWFVAEGDTITEDSILVEVESDKVVAELPCPVTGTIAKLHVPQGQKALVGSVI